MHSAPIFKVDDLVWIQKLVTDHPLGWISAWVHGQVDSHPVPLIWTGRGLVGHLLASQLVEALVTQTTRRSENVIDILYLLLYIVAILSDKI